MGIAPRVLHLFLVSSMMIDSLEYAIDVNFLPRDNRDAELTAPSRRLANY